MAGQTEDIAQMDERFMREALAEAKAAAAEGEVPIGAVVACGGEVITRARNRRELDADPSAHAEFRAIVEAARRLGRWRLTDCTVYVTLEPCCMCAGLMVNARIGRCVYGAPDPKGGALGSLYRLHDDRRLNHVFPVTAGVLSDECGAVLRAFFLERRARDTGRGDAVAAGDAAHRTALEAAPQRDAAPVPSSWTDPAPHILLAIDSFKGSASSRQAERWVAEGIRSVLSKAHIKMLPIADGGEGTLEAVRSALGGELRVSAVQGPGGSVVQASWLAAKDVKGGRVAVIEIAEAAGIALSDRSGAAALGATTYGVGELVRAACEAGACRIYIGLGGSATSDGGAGFLQALGARLTTAAGDDVRPGLAGLADCASIDLEPARSALAGVELIALTDVTNPLVGPRGTLPVFGPQKGVDTSSASFPALERAMISYGAKLDGACRRLIDPPFRSLAGVPGSGAAGGLGVAVLALGGALVSGIDAVLDLVGFDEAARGADLVVTGEGAMDGQTAAGKAPVGVARRAKRLVPTARVIAVVGGRADDLDGVYRQGIDLVCPVVRRPMALERALERDEARANLRCAGESVARIWLLGASVG